MKLFARVSGDWADRQYANAFAGMDGLFFDRAKNRPLVPPSVGYFANWYELGKRQGWSQSKFLEEIERIAESKKSVPEIILFNEIFLGPVESNCLKTRLKNFPVRRALGDDWLCSVAKLVRRICPNSRLWLCDFRPRDILMWNSVEDYLQDYKPVIDGIGIQCHVTMRFVLDKHLPWSIGLPLKLLEQRFDRLRRSGYELCIPEITVWPGVCPSQEQIEKMGAYYKAILDLGLRKGCFWAMFWSLTDCDKWHFVFDRKDPCGLFDNEFKWKFRDWSLEDYGIKNCGSDCGENRPKKQIETGKVSNIFR
jgi:hypothetical protein